MQLCVRDGGFAEQSDSDPHADDQNRPKQVGALRRLKAHTDAEFKEIMQAVKVREMMLVVAVQLDTIIRR